MQWDGQHWVWESEGYDTVLDEAEISGRTATLVGSIQFTNLSNRDRAAFWIQDGSLFAMYKKVLKNNNQGVAVWPYPSGGNATAKFFGITKGRKDYMTDLTVSVNPSR